MVHRAVMGIDMGIAAFLATGFGAFFGACLRYLFGLWFNPVFPTIPLGTLAANLLGGLVMGVVMALFTQFQALSPEARLFIATGFLGGLTTFSTFSAETVTLLLRREYAWMFGLVGLHLVGTLGMTVLGFGLVRGIARAWT
jgi:fluoride exporter